MANSRSSSGWSVLGDCRWKVVAEAPDDLVRRIVDPEPAGNPAAERGHEQAEREDGKQEAIRHLGGEPRDVVLAHAGDEPSADPIAVSRGSSETAARGSAPAFFDAPALFRRAFCHVQSVRYL